MTRLALLLLGAGALLMGGQARANSVTFGDSVHYWPGYQNGTSDDAKDTIGTPDLLGGTANFTGGKLASLSIDYYGKFSLATPGHYGSVIPGDLFIDAGADGDWDYVVKLVASDQMPASYASLDILDVAGESNAYLYSGSDNTGHWHGYLIRDRHPYAWNGGGTVVDHGSLGPVSLLTGGNHTLSFDLGGGLDVGKEFILAFGPSCANDVIFEKISNPVPEPSAALVFAAGLLLAIRRRRA